VYLTLPVPEWLLYEDEGRVPVRGGELREPQHQFPVRGCEAVREVSARQAEGVDTHLLAGEHDGCADAQGAGVDADDGPVDYRDLIESGEAIGHENAGHAGSMPCMSTAIAVLAAVEGSDIIVAFLVALLVAVIVWAVFQFLIAPQYAGPVAAVTFLIVLLLILLENGSFD
jgi:hypothetical protein